LLERVVADRLTLGDTDSKFAVRTSVCLMSNSLDVGGSERQFVAMVEALSRERFDVHPACLRRTGGFSDRLGKIPEFPPGGSLFGLRAQRARFAMVRSLRRDKIAVAHAFDFYTNLTLIPAAKLAGLPVVIGSHRQLGDLLTRSQFRAQLCAFHFADRVVCNSRAAAARLLEAGLRETKLEVIPNGLGERAFDECVPALPRKPGIVRVGMIGRMNDDVKNHPFFLRTAANLKKRVPGVEFVLIGDGSRRPRLELMAAELGIGEQTIFLGERHDIPAVLASLDISVLVSSSESLSNVILESMAAGVAVAATNVGGNSELLNDGETGVLVPPDNEEKLVRVLEQLVQDPALRTRYGVRAKQFARAHFHMDQICRRYEQLYVSLLSEKMKT
jgi:glycosyltransferase involved in cell wall biosynthesis